MEPLGSFQACNGIALPLLLYLNTYSLFTLQRLFCKSVVVGFNFQVHFELNVISLMFNLFVIQCVYLVRSAADAAQPYTYVSVLTAPTFMAISTCCSIC